MELNKKNTRIAGALYLILTVFGIFAEFFVRMELVVRGDALATYNNILANEWLFRAGFVSDIICQTSHLLLVLLLYAMFKSISKNAALFMLSCVLISVSITFINLLNHFAAILIINNSSGYLSVFSTEQVNALVLLFLDLHQYGYSIPGVFFGLWLFPLGYLIYKSNRFPKLIGVLLMIACFGYLIDFLVVFLFPAYEVVTYPGLAIAVVGELSICFWLLIVGVKTKNISDNN